MAGLKNLWCLKNFCWNICWKILGSTFQGSRVITGGRGGVSRVNKFFSFQFSKKKILCLEFSLKKNLGLISRGGVGGRPPPHEHNRVKNFVYHLTLVGKVSIPNLRPLGPPLHVEKFVWWVVVCKVILVFRFGPRLGLKWKTWTQLNNSE